jgi:hypothetical protein
MSAGIVSKARFKRSSTTRPTAVGRVTNLVTARPTLRFKIYARLRSASAGSQGTIGFGRTQTHHRPDRNSESGPFGGRFQRALLRVSRSHWEVCHAKGLERLAFLASLFLFRIDDQLGLLLTLLKRAPRRRPSGAPFNFDFFHDLSSGIQHGRRQVSGSFYKLCRWLSLTIKNANPVRFVRFQTLREMDRFAGTTSQKQR